MVRALAFLHCDLGLLPLLGVMWVEFVVGFSSVLREVLTLGLPVFPSHQHFKISNLIWIIVEHFIVNLGDCASLPCIIDIK